VLLRAVKMTPTIPADSLPPVGTFYSAQHAPGTAQPWPPLPVNSRQVPVWDLGDGVFLMADEQVDYSEAPLSLMSLSMASGMRASPDGLTPPPGGTFYSDSFNFTPDYGTNLWLAITNLANNAAGLFISNTVPDIQYEVQYTPDLLQPWQSAGWFVFGSELTNWTPFSVPAFSPTNLFLRVRSWQDDGSGLPLWWQAEYFGTNGVDPYGDPMCDGWNNLQKFQNGMNPNVFYTPPAPASVNRSPPPGCWVSGAQLCGANYRLTISIWRNSSYSQRTLRAIQGDDLPVAYPVDESANFHHHGNAHRLRQYGRMR